MSKPQQNIGEKRKALDPSSMPIAEFISRKTSTIRTAVPDFSYSLKMPVYPPLGMKPSQAAERGEFLEVLKGIARNSPTGTAEMLATRKFNGYAVHLKLTRFMQISVVCPKSGIHLEGYEVCLRDSGTLPQFIWPDGDTPCVFCAEATAYVCQSPADSSFDASPQIEVGHDGVRSASNFYLTWRNNPATRDRKCPVRLVLDLYAWHTMNHKGWGPHVLSGAQITKRSSELLMLQQAFKEDSILRVVKADKIRVFADGSVQAAESDSPLVEDDLGNFVCADPPRTPFADFFESKIAEANRQKIEGFVLEINDTQQALLHLTTAAGKPKARFHLAHQWDSIERNRLSLKNKPEFFIRCAVQIRSMEKMPRHKGQKNYPLYALWKGARHWVGALAYPPKWLYEQPPDSFHIITVPFTWGSKLKGHLVGIKTPRDNESNVQNVPADQILCQVDDVNTVLDRVAHFGAIEEQKERLKQVIEHVENNDSAFIKRLPPKSAQPPEASQTDTQPLKRPALGLPAN